MTSSAGLEALRPSPADVRVVTSDGGTIEAHSSVLASASPVLERMIERAPRIRILGASPDAVAAFLRFLYTPREPAAGEAAMAAHGAALLALAHAHRVPWLKRRAEEAVAARLTAERAVDALKLARLCDAPRLYLRCARLAGKDLAAVERSEGWRFAARHDPALQLDLLRLLHDADQRKKRWERERASQAVYRQLSDAMASLDRVFTDKRRLHGATRHRAAGEAPGRVRQQGRRRRRLPALQARLPAPPAPLLRLRPRRALRSPLVQQSQDEDAGGESGQDVEAPREEGGEGRSHGDPGQQGGAGDREEVAGQIQQWRQQE